MNNTPVFFYSLYYIIIINKSLTLKVLTINSSAKSYKILGLIGKKVFPLSIMHLYKKLNQKSISILKGESEKVRCVK